MHPSATPLELEPEPEPEPELDIASVEPDVASVELEDVDGSTVVALVTVVDAVDIPTLVIDPDPVGVSLVPDVASAPGSGGGVGQPDTAASTVQSARHRSVIDRGYRESAARSRGRCSARRGAGRRSPALRSAALVLSALILSAFAVDPAAIEWSSPEGCRDAHAVVDRVIALGADPATPDTDVRGRAGALIVRST